MEIAVTPEVTDSNGVATGSRTGNFMSEFSQRESLAYHGFNIAFNGSKYQILF